MPDAQGRRHVLVVTLGLSPAVVTETLWAMLNPRQGEARVVVDEVHVLTTARWSATDDYAELDRREQVLRDRLEELFKAHGESPPALTFEAVEDPEGGERRYIEDVSTQRENIVFAGRVTQLVHDLARDANGNERSDTVIHMSLAGGRKSMSSYAHTAMMFFGRIQDDLTHVLVDPPELERCGPTFWYPGQKQKAMFLSHEGPGSTVEATEVDTSVDKARVELVQVPFVRLNVVLPKGVKIEYADYPELVDFIQFVRSGEKVVLDFSTRRIQVGTKEADLAPTEFAIMAVLAIAKLQGWPGHGPDRSSAGDCGWVSLNDMGFAEDRRTGGPNRHPAFEILREVLFELQDSDQYQKTMKALTNIPAGEGSPISQWRSRMDLGRRLDSAYRGALVTPHVDPKRPGVGSVWGLNIPPERLEIRNFPQRIIDLGKQLGTRA